MNYSEDHTESVAYYYDSLPITDLSLETLGMAARHCNDNFVVEPIKVKSYAVSMRSKCANDMRPYFGYGWPKLFAIGRRG